MSINGHGNRLLEIDKGNRAYKTTMHTGLRKYPTQPVYSWVPHYTEPARSTPNLNNPAHNSKTDPKNQETKTGSSSTLVSMTGKTGWSRRLADWEMSRRRELGLCFKCGEKYSSSHICKDKKLQMFAVDVDANNSEKKSNKTCEAGDDYYDADDETARMVLSLKSFAGIESNRTMKGRGELAREAIIVLIDNGATCNYIAKNLLNRPGIKIDEVAEYIITIGDGHSIRRRQLCRDVILKLQSLCTVQTFYPLIMNSSVHLKHRDEEADTLATQFPSFHLEDKVRLLGEGNERTLLAGQAHVRKTKADSQDKDKRGRYLLRLQG